MKCPVCDVGLKTAEREGVDIDYCPRCRGVWLDRGELDKIIEQSAAPESSERERKDFEEREPSRRRRKRGFLGELFEFD